MTNARERSALPKILLVDDEPDVALTTALILRMEGFDVVTAASGDSALKLVEEIEPDAVVSDFMMPWMDGRQLVENLRARGRQCPVLIVSGIDPGEPAPWDAFLRKPAFADELVRVLHKLIAAARPNARG